MNALINLLDKVMLCYYYLDLNIKFALGLLEIWRKVASAVYIKRADVDYVMQWRDSVVSASVQYYAEKLNESPTNADYRLALTVAREGLVRGWVSWKTYHNICTKVAEGMN